MEGRFWILPPSSGFDLESSQEGGERESKGSVGSPGMAREQSVVGCRGDGSLEEAVESGQCVLGSGMSKRDCVRYI